MDYKEKYEQALERARQFSEKPYLEDSAGIVEYIFPELAESEDERIKEEIISFVEQAIDAGYGIIDKERKDKWIAWLEKQGEQPKKHDVCDNCDQQGSCVSPCPMKLVEKQCEKNPAWSEKYIADVFEKVGLAKIAREQGYDALSEAIQSTMIELSKFTPQPRLEWSEEDEICCYNTIHYLEEPELLEYNKPNKEIVINWLKSLKDRVLPQPKQEWSEEDEQTFIESVEALEDFGKFELADWLKEHKNKFLRSQKVQKVSKEDLEKMGKQIDEYNKLLEQLRPQPHWKPSDEQMKQLGWVAEQNKDNMIGKELMTLYNDLKKL